ncbi:MAG: YegS/Rv2252/BmrU family lipid kinase [Candidatus Eremiobacteraeota bacterium]|nr:YegS/Rv2252/BmrU family lipid kinase [Candidatus Eremiobacteraeota bacterium]
MATRQAVVISSGRSRRGKEAHACVPSLLLQRGIEVLDARLEPTRELVAKAIKKAMRAGTKLVIVCGGDGTQTHAVPLFANASCTLGIVPAGTGNSFALGLGIEDSFERAADAIAYGEEARVDLGIINDTYFANFVTVGLPSQVAAETPRPLKSLVGAVAYGLAGIVPLLTHKPFRAEFRWKGHQVRVQTHQIIIANGRFYGHQPLARDASLVDGRLTVYVRNATSRMDLLESYVSLLRGDPESLSGVHLWSTPKTISVRTKRKAPVAVDGSLFCKTPIRVGVAPKALRVMVPSVSGMPA